jgi:hypothetical protein
LVGTAKHDVVDAIGGKAGPVEQPADGGAGQVVRPDVGQRTARPPDRRADGAQNERVDRGGVAQKEYLSPAWT